MALSFFSKSALLRSVLGSFSQVGRAIAPYSMARRLVRENPALSGLNFSAAQALANQAQRIWDAGKRLNSRSVNPLQRAEVPIDPTIGPNDPRYRYRVLVQLNQGGMVVASTVIEVDSGALLTRAALFAQTAQFLEQGDSPRRAQGGAFATALPDSIPTYTVLTAGRRA